MAQAQVVQMPGGATTPGKALLGPIQEKVKGGLEDRGRFEPVWHSNRAFGAGKHWLKHSRSDRRLVLDKRDVADGKERVTVDRLTQYVNTGLGQLSGLEERPQLLFRRDDLPTEDFTEVANDGLQYGWDSEWKAKRQLNRVKRRLVIDGTAAIQCYFDPTKGRELGDVPLGDGYPVPLMVDEETTEDHPTIAGKPILDPQVARGFVAHRASMGQTAQFKRLNEGRICWRPLSVFNLVVPPGIEDEDDFPWVAVMTAVPIESLILRYGDRAKGLKEEELAALQVLGLKDAAPGLAGTDEEDYGGPGKLRGHATQVQFFQMPDTQHRKGRVITYAGDLLLDVQNELPYEKPNSDRAAGITMFHYWRVEGRFWGRGLIEPGKGIQRTYNKRCQQEQLTIDRGQPKVMLEEQSEIKTRSQTPLEVIRYRSGTAEPKFLQGLAVGDTMWRSKEGLIGDLEGAMGIHGVSTGEEPSRETTYAELALRAEKDRTKLDPITERFQAGVHDLTEFSLWDMREYWPADKIIALEGETGQAESVQFQASKLPTFFLLKIADGTKPRDQASQIQLIFDLWNADKALPPEQQRLKLSWLKDSVDVGRPLPLPPEPSDIQLEKAEWENSQMWEGNLPEPQPWDEIGIHGPTHREAQIEAEMADRPDVVQLIQRHLDESLGLLEALAREQQANDAASVAAQAGPAGVPGGQLGPAPDATGQTGTPTQMAPPPTEGAQPSG